MARTTNDARMTAIEAAQAEQRALLEKLVAHVTGAPATPAQSVATPTRQQNPLLPAPAGFRITGIRHGTTKNGNPVVHVHVETPGYRGFKGAGSFIVFPQE